MSYDTTIVPAAAAYWGALKRENAILFTSTPFAIYRHAPPGFAQFITIPAAQTNWKQALAQDGSVYFVTQPSLYLYKVNLEANAYDTLISSTPAGLSSIVGLYVSHIGRIFAIASPGEVLLQADIPNNRWLQLTTASPASGILAFIDTDILLCTATAIYRYNSATAAWVALINPAPRIYSSIIYDGKLFLGGSRFLYRYDPPGLTAVSQSVSFGTFTFPHLSIYRNELFAHAACTAPANAWRVYQWDKKDNFLFTVYVGRGTAPALLPFAHNRGVLMALAQPAGGFPQLLDLYIARSQDFTSKTRT